MAVVLGVTFSNDSGWNAHILTKLVNATKKFNFLPHSVPHQIPSRVKLNIFQSCVVSIILYCFSPWSSVAYITKTDVLFEISASYFCSCRFQSESWYLGVLLFYILGRTSNFHIEYSVVILDLKLILTEIERIIPSASHSVEVLVLGDFNFRKACWDTASSTLSDEQYLIDFLCVDTSLVQIIDSPLHKSGDILDWAYFSHEHYWSHTVLDRDMSDHSPIILITDVVKTLENHELQFSFAQFHYNLFKELLVLIRALAESCHSESFFFVSKISTFRPRDATFVS